MKKIILGTTAAMLMAAGTAHAAFIMYLDDASTAGIDRIVQDDTLAGVLTGIGLTTTGDLDPTTGSVVYTGGFGSFLMNATVGLSKPVLDGPGNIFDLNSVSVSGSAGSLTIGLTDTDFYKKGAGFLNFSIGGTTDGSIAASAYMDASNIEFGTGTLLGSMSYTGGGLNSGFGYNSSGTAINGTDPYSLTLVTTITHANATDTTSFDAAVVPEPSILALISLGLVGLGFAGRRKQGK